MINYIKLHFGYVFSSLFIIGYVITITLISLGIIISSNLSLSYEVLDINRDQYYLEYLSQSILIIEIIVLISHLFMTSLLFANANQKLIRYCTYLKNHQLKYYISRIITMIFVDLLTIFLVFLFLYSFTRYFTPFYLDLALLYQFVIAVFLLVLSIQAMLALLLSLINHIFVITLPIIAFWYAKTIMEFEQIEMFSKKIILELIPVFLFFNNKIIYFKNVEKYLYQAIFLLLLTLIINIIKDN